MHEYLLRIWNHRRFPLVASLTAAGVWGYGSSLLIASPVGLFVGFGGGMLLGALGVRWSNRRSAAALNEALAAMRAELTRQRAVREARRRAASEN